MWYPPKLKGPIGADGRVSVGDGIHHDVAAIVRDPNVTHMPSMAIAYGLTMPLVIEAFVFCLPLFYIAMLPWTSVTGLEVGHPQLPDGLNATPVGRLIPAVMVAVGCRTSSN